MECSSHIFFRSLDIPYIVLVFAWHSAALFTCSETFALSSVMQLRSGLLPEFQLPNMFSHCDLRRQAASRWALPQICSCLHL